MTALGAIDYDPAVAASVSTASLLAMTAVDTTNLRITFTAPTSGNVLIRMRATVPASAAPTFPRILLGVLDGATVKLRMAPMGQYPLAAATTLLAQEIVGCVTGLTPGQSYTWDAAYGVEVVIAATVIKYGGPNDNSGADAWGGFVFEVWDAANLLAGKAYDPAAAVTAATTALLAMTAFDTANLRNTFTAPATGKVHWRIHVQQHGSTTYGQPLLGILEGATVRARVAPIMGLPQVSNSNACVALEASGVISGLTPGNSYSYDAAYAVQTVAGAGGIKYGGPNDTTINNAFGAAVFEIWAA